MSITLSPAVLTDADAIAALLKECWAATYSSFLSTRTLEDLAQQWHHPDILRRQITNPKVAFLLARTDSGILVGAGNAKLVADGVAVDVQRLYVHPAYQRQGIGSHLLRTILAAFPKAQTIDLEVAELNGLGRAFWMKCGFRESGRSQIGVGDAVLDLVKMSKRVAA
jgi:ribosomal protein S18 acetylase RimI-like enzyme